VLKVIKNVHLAIGSFGCNYFLILWHIPCLVNFALVINLNVDWDSCLLHIGYTGASDSVGVIVQNILFVVPSVFGGLQWYFNL
jgi:hypothetical protein